ncbi:glycosyltransferase family 4 protein [Mucilaginibacter ginkgonis]|uniref:Glycosyltransferase family 4 protein n=1 Tax=Mucilaginibacter ginkgonis TaxID=2682091 RepID=A0A6I4HW47_9SPHI|nr:glycosyltransferase family 4 protein [Mucilaginibacter ginkgonis]QQL50200.1 glycosyltransferase family 4 protein [Mucilaginibacter ginkgonis]
MKSDNKIVYVTTNESWGGSEELWSRSAKGFIEKGYQVVYASKYKHNNITQLNGTHYLFKDRFKTSLIKRALNKLLPDCFKVEDVIAEMLKKEKPVLVILSQGNNIDKDDIMKCCRDLKIPYVTMTQLVTEFHFLSITAENLSKLQDDYLFAAANYFVSEKNLRLNNLMLALQPTNAEIINSPLIIKREEIPVYPLTSEVFKIGLIGRIECFHKGYDLLLQLAAMEKWKSRPVEFNVYGDGPHTNVLAENIALLGISNVKLKGYKKSIEIWADNHILFMPSRMEGMSLALIEAMYCKRAAVVTDVGDAARLIKNDFNGFVAETASVASLDHALENGWQQRHRWRQMGENASSYLTENYDAVNAAEHFNNKILHLLNNVIN